MIERGRDKKSSCTGSAGGGGRRQLSISYMARPSLASTHTTLTTPPVRLAVRLAIAGKGFKDIKSLTAQAYGDQALKRMQIYAIMKQVKEGGDVEDWRGGAHEH